MKTYQEILETYRKRQHDTVVDTLAAGLTYADEIAVDGGLLEETGIMTELSETLTGALPFVVIAVTEGTRVLLKRKPAKTGLKDGVYRAVKTGAALGVGTAVVGAAGLIPAIPVTMGVRALFDRYRSKALTGMRVRGRIDRLRELNRFIRQEDSEEKEPDWNTETMMPIETIGSVE